MFRLDRGAALTGREANDDVVQVAEEVLALESPSLIKVLALVEARVPLVFFGKLEFGFAFHRAIGLMAPFVHVTAKKFVTAANPTPLAPFTDKLSDTFCCPAILVAVCPYVGTLTMGQARLEFADVAVSSAGLSFPVRKPVLATPFVTGCNILICNLAWRLRKRWCADPKQNCAENDDSHVVSPRVRDAKGIKLPSYRKRMASALR